MIALFILPLLFLFSTPAYPQISCMNYGNMLSCDGPNLSNRTITDFGQGRGIITDEKGNIEPYMVLPSTPSRRDEPTLKPWPRSSFDDRWDRYGRSDSLLPSWRDEPIWDRD